MDTEKLTSYDFNSINTYIENLNNKIFHETKGGISLVSVVIDGDKNKICTMSTLDKQLLFKLLIVIAVDCFPVKTKDEIDDEIRVALQGSGKQLKDILDELMRS